MKNWKSLEAYQHLDWVGTVLMLKCFMVKTKAAIFKADVRPSQRVNETPHHPWVAVDENETIVIAAHCDCMAGLGESCSHIAGLLFKIEASVRLGFGEQTCTDMACRWNNDFVRQIKPARLTDIVFSDMRSLKKKKSASRAEASKTKVIDLTTKSIFLTKLSLLSKRPVCLSLFKDYCEAFIPESDRGAPPEPKVPAGLNSWYNADKFGTIRKS
ncbi:Uncharacterised protein g1989 [Pycnogonum litorale]